MWIRPVLVLVAGVLVATGCAGVLPRPTPSEPTLVATQAGPVTLLSSADLAAAPRQVWLERLQWATTTLSGAHLGVLVAAWDGHLVVELPATPTQYHALAGAGADEAAAVTRCPAEGARVTVNPAVEDTAADYLDSLVLHEAVHIATGSSCDAEAPQWVEEGIAEWVASEHSSESLAANQAWVEEYLRSSGVPAGLPPDADFTGDPDAVSAAYGLARQAVVVAIDQLGQAAAMDFFAGHFTGTPDETLTAAVTGWYLAELTRLSGSGPR